MTEINSPVSWHLCESLVELRAKLQRLEQTGDSSSPTIANLKRIVSKRIAEVETAVQLQKEDHTYN